MSRPTEPRHPSLYTKRVWIAALVAASTLLLLTLLFLGREILLLIFAGLLMALLISLPTDWLLRHTFLSRRWSLVVVIGGLIMLLGAFMANFATNALQQFHQMSQVLPQSVSHLEQQLRGWPFGDRLVSHLEQNGSAGDVFSSWLTRVETLLSSTFGALINTVVVIFIGLYVAIEPDTYRNGLLSLVPPQRRQGSRVLMKEVRSKLSWWLIGQLVSMAVVGLLTGIGLWLLGIPLALSLGLLAALMEFIPNFGPLLAAGAALLVAFSQDPQALWHVALLYTGIQFVESYLLTPWVQREAVAIPPGLLIAVQVALGLMAGILGLLVAAPLTALCMVLIQRLYVEGWLGEGTIPSSPEVSSQAQESE
ncbi:putative PurR-regulated permease PerM [Kushneria sinocarnis]|uniref:Putative PurR-regulated permease PerM n=1 Tax=Kushneria sinocarnis TaxID=595502 RepID=A0A420WTS9_9GAMM|nr:AI-2E family transporter [Kushneria sinocarnis]RKQ96380.1 putative PurR-regulated permease PerM [Kushneria sinocarnis]